MQKTSILLAALVAAVTLAQPAHAKPARCAITAEVTSYKGPCKFSLARGGTFTLTPASGGAFGEIRAITVHVTGPGVAQVTGLTADGEDLAWGRAVRSSRNPACWVGRAFSVCAS